MKDAGSDQPKAEPPDTPENRRYRWTVVGMCFLTFLTASLDRHVFGLVIDPIKQDLQLSDSELGLLTGAAFVVFYLICGLPFGRLLDSRPRPKVLGAAMIIWSGGTLLTGFAGSFLSIFSSRAVVGAGEAGVSPATASMVSDAFAGRSLAKPMTIISLGTTLGPGLALGAGGLILGMFPSGQGPVLPLVGQTAPWQIVFLVMGLPGLILAPFMLRLRDPVRRRLALDASGKATKPTLREAFRFVGANPVLCGLVIGGFAMLQVVATGIAAWAPSFFRRTFDLPTSSIGLYLGAGYIAVGVLAFLLNANWMDRRMRKGDAAAPLKLAGSYALLGVVPMLILGKTDRIEIAAAAMFFVQFFATAVMAASVAWARILPNQVRAQVISIHLFSTSLIGGMAGPYFIGLITDQFKGDPGALRFAFTLVCGVSLAVAGLLLWSGVPTYAKTARLIDETTL